MRVINLFATSMVLVILCASNALSIGDSIGKSVDQLIDESNGIHNHDVYHPENPQEARALWSLERGVNFTMPGKVLGNGTSTSSEASDFSAEINEEIQNQIAANPNAAQTSSPQEIETSQVSTSQAATSQAATSQAATSQAATSQAATSQAATSQAATSQVATSQVATSQAASVAGNWSFRLRDSKNRIMALRLFQTDSAVFGTGTINDGGDTLPVSASGSVEGDKLYMDATSSGTVTLYRLALTASGNSASGEYRAASSTGGETWMGLAEGVRIQ